MTTPTISWRGTPDDLQLQLFVDGRLCGTIEAWKFNGEDDAAPASWFPAWTVDADGHRTDVRGIFARTLDQAQIALLKALGLPVEAGLEEDVADQAEERPYGDVTLLPAAALAFLDARADEWADRVGLDALIAAAHTDPSKIAALARQAYVEGAYDGATGAASALATTRLEVPHT